MYKIDGAFVGFNSHILTEFYQSRIAALAHCAAALRQLSALVLWTSIALAPSALAQLTPWPRARVAVGRAGEPGRK